MSETSANNFMILDDNSNNALFWEMTITGAFDGAKVTVCRTGYEALEVAKTSRFDFFISSWELEPVILKGAHDSAVPHHRIHPKL